MSILHSLVDILSAKPVLTRKDLQRMFGRSKNTIDRWHTDGLLPRARYIGRNPFWSATAILSHMKKKPNLVKTNDHATN